MMVGVPRIHGQHAIERERTMFRMVQRTSEIGRRHSLQSVDPARMQGGQQLQRYLDGSDVVVGKLPPLAFFVRPDMRLMLCEGELEANAVVHVALGNIMHYLP